MIRPLPLLICLGEVLLGPLDSAGLRVELSPGYAFVVSHGLHRSLVRMRGPYLQ